MTQVVGLRRSLLYVPGDRPEMLAKAGARGADGIILNLEDAVAAASKERARETVVRSLQHDDFGSSERIVRINSLEGESGLADLLAVAPLGPDAILLSKVASAEHVRFAAWLIDGLEKLYELPAGKILIMCMVETARGILAAPEIGSAHARVTAVVFGAADFTADVRCEMTEDQRSQIHAASHLVMAARSARIAAIDAPHMRLGDSEGLARGARISRELGFDGKCAIHPGQIPAIHAAFSPTVEQIGWAASVTDALAANGADEGVKGAALLQGELVEAPHLLRAQRILEAARQMGMEDKLAGG
jgi:citrate lyase subunit beta/citryl-CoA lyase